ncbi:OmpA family protein [Blattabacterium cuenoti]|uniref:OmpA family protein n=1 Tax=Blattabacterium cuenoti TaxID=1653831 RepID=UPI00163BC422|nr:OmpA family protein [Blattabacterium cuenoti]
MKNANFFIITLFFTLFSFFSLHAYYSYYPSAYFQNLKEEEEKGKWLLKLGLYDINYYPIRSPFKGIFEKDHNSISPVVSNLELEYSIKRNMGLYFDASLGMINNKRWKSENDLFVKISNGVTYYILPHHKFDPYLRVGAGYHKFKGYIERELKIEDGKYLQTSRDYFLLLDGGVGMNIWMAPNFGINFNTTYNHIFESRAEDYLNFWKHNLGFVFRFGNEQINNENQEEEIDRSQEYYGIQDHSYFPIIEKRGRVEEKICCQTQKEKEKKDNKNNNKKDSDDNNKSLNKDSDNDEVLDQEDLCPNQTGLRKFKGCPDTDQDNIPDNEDDCPKKFGKKENKGCPDIFFRPISFGIKKFTLTPLHLRIIGDIADVITNYFPKSKFYVDGYTDSNGKPRYNKMLAMRRANAVLKALIEKGIDPNKLEARGLTDGGKNSKNKKGKRVVEIVMKKY